MLKGFLGEKENYLNDILFAIPFGLIVSLTIWGIVTGVVATSSGSLPDVSVFIISLVFGVIIISSAAGILVSRISKIDKRAALRWAMLALPFSMGIVFIPILLLMFLLQGVEGVLSTVLASGIFIFGGLIAWLLGNLINTKLAKIEDEKKVYWAKISISILLLLLGLVFIFVFYAPLFAIYYLI